MTGTSSERARTFSTPQTTSRERTTGEELSNTETESDTLTQVVGRAVCEREGLKGHCLPSR